MLYERRYRYISCFVEYKNMYIVVSSTNNQVYFWDREKECVVENILLKEEQSDRSNLFSQCLILEDTLILIPENAEHLVLCNLKDKEICYLEIPENYLKLVRTGNQMFFFMGCKSGNLYQLDLVTNRFNHVDYIDNQMLTNEKIKPLSDLIFMNGICINDKIVFPFRRHPKIYIFDIKTNKANIKTIADNTGFVDLVYEKGFYYLLSEDGIIYILDDEFHNIEMIQFHIEKVKRLRYPFRYIGIYKKQIMLLPMYSRKIEKIDLKNKEVQEIDASKIFYGTGKYYIYKENDTGYGNKIVVLQSENTNGAYIDIEREMIERFLQIEENSITDFIHMEKCSVDEKGLDTGKKIWITLRNGIQY